MVEIGLIFSSLSNPRKRNLHPTHRLTALLMQDESCKAQGFAIRYQYQDILPFLPNTGRADSTTHLSRPPFDSWRVGDEFIPLPPRD